MKKFLFLLAILVALNLNVKSQIEGLWLVEEVLIDEEVKTPVAKWTVFNKDGTSEGGNGWLKNSEGNWEFDDLSAELKLEETFGFNEDAPPFKVATKGNSMVWVREENGQQVKVTLNKIKALPKGPSDMLVGSWSFESIDDKENVSEGYTQLFKSNHLVFRWDKVFRIENEDSKIGGYWHMHAHKPELTFIFYNQENKYEFWTVEFEKDNLILGNVHQPIKMVFKKN